MVAATYAAMTLLSVATLQGLAWGPVQFRVSEALTSLALLTPAAVPGLAIGCFVANLAALSITGVGPIGLLDVVFGTLATLLGALFTRRFRGRPVLAMAGPVIANAAIVAAYLPVLVKGFGFYTVPFTDIDIEGALLPMYLFGFVSIALGQAVVVYGLGLPLAAVLRRIGVLWDGETPSE